MAKLFACKTIVAGAENSLKEIDPLDSEGDGSNIPLEVGNRAVVIGYNSMIIFYSLKSAVGHTDDGFEEVIPENNPGDFYWKCQGYTKDTFTGAVTDQEFTVENGSPYPPNGFTGGQLSYGVSSIQKLEFVGADNWAMLGVGLYNDYLYVLYDTGYVKQDWNALTLTGPHAMTGNSEGFDFYWSPSHCAEGVDGSEKYITDLHDPSTNPTKLARFNMDTEVSEHIDIIFPDGWVDWITFEPNIANLKSRSALRYKNEHYFVGGSYTTESNKAFKIDVLTGLMTVLSNLPGNTLIGCNCMDFLNERMYFIPSSSGTNETMYMYDLDSGEWTAKASCPGHANIDAIGMMWHDEKTETIVVPVHNEGNWVYDTALNTWENTALVDTNLLNDEFYLSYQIAYRDIGAIWPWGYCNPTPQGHGLIPVDNPVIITKV